MFCFGRIVTVITMVWYDAAIMIMTSTFGLSDGEISKSILVRTSSQVQVGNREYMTTIIVLVCSCSCSMAPFC
jgi:hypothetical protein